MLAAYASDIDPKDPLSGLAIGDRPEPEVPDGWTTVTVKAASLNHHDLWSLRGVGLPEDRLPMILGCDAAGLDEDGNEVVVHAVIASDDWRGDETFDPRRSLLSERYQGAFAERVAVRAATCVPKPPELTFEQAACLPTAWLTAYRMLFTRGKVVPGPDDAGAGRQRRRRDRADVLASATGVRVWVTGRSEDKREQALCARRRRGVRIRRAAARARRRGDRDHRQGDLGTLDPLAQARRHAGRLRRYHGRAEPAELTRIFFLQLSVVGSTMGTRDELERLMRLCVDRDMRPVIHAHDAARRRPSGI